MARKLSGIAAVLFLMWGCSQNAVESAVGDAGPGPALDAGPGSDAGVDAGCAVPCGEACCGEHEVCDAEQGRCVPECVPEPDSSLCQRASASCGELTADDNCGEARTVNCGSCTAPDSCDLATHTCVCGESEAEVCSRLLHECGPLGATDLCGVARTIASCGTCASNELCNASSQCELCIGETDAELCTAAGAECGPKTLTDRCGVPRTIASCGACTAPDSCDLTTFTCVCGETDAQVCGRLQHECGSLSATDLCGVAHTIASCGTCASNELCNASSQCELCIGETDAELCTAAGAHCGAKTLTDRCGVRRTIASCGACTAPDSCDLTTFTCVCGETDAQVCSRLQHECGSLSATDLCGVSHTVASCGTCGTHELCNASSQCELCVGETDAALCTAAAVECGATTRTDRCGDTRSIATCGTCTAPETCQSGDCRLPPPPPNDTCAAPEALTFVAGTATTTGSTRWAFDDTISACAAALSPDATYRFTLIDPARVLIKVTRGAASPAYLPSFYLRSNCSSSAAADEVVCAAAAANGVAQVNLTWLAAGTWYVIVDGADATGGEFTLEVTQTAPVAGDSCGNPQAMLLDTQNGTASAAGDVSLARVDSASSCAAAGAGDLVYRLDLPSEKSIQVTVTPTASSALYPTVALRTACGDTATERACKAQSQIAAASFFLLRAGPGPVFVWVSAADAAHTGAFTLDVTTADTQPAPTDDTCATPTVLAADASSTVQGSTYWASDSGAGTCAGATSPFDGADRIYSLTLNSAASVFAVINKDPTETRTFYPAIYLRSTCGSALPADELACASTAGGTATSFTVDLQPGTYYLFVDGQSGTSGAYLLDVVVRSSRTMANDACGGAETITLDANGKGVAGGSTTGLMDDYFGSCTAGSTSLDVVYKVTTTATKNLNFTVLGSTGFAPSVFVRTTCATTATERGCVSSPAADQPATLSISRAPAGTYYVVVEGVTAGTFALTAAATAPDPAPAEDACATATSVTLPASGAPATRINGSTFTASDDAVGGCSVTGTLHNGPDVYYTFTVSTATQVTAKVTPKSSSPNYRAAVYIRTNCTSNTNGVCVNAAGAGSANPATLTTSLAPGDYVLVVDGIGSWGDFTLDLSTNDANYINGDRCINAISLQSAFQTVNGEQVATISGDTTNAGSDENSLCKPNSGNDLVYYFTVASDAVVKFAVQPDGTSSNLAPVVYLRSSCSDTTAAAEKICVSSATKSARAASVPVTAGAYYLFVDNYSTSYSGPFTGTVTIAAPVSPPANDSCANPTQITLPASGTGSQHILASTMGATNDLAGGCETVARPLNGGDLVYTFEVTTNTYLTAKVTPQTNSWYYLPALYIRTTCGTVNNDLCNYNQNAGSAATISVSVPPGVYYLIVDSVSQTWGDFDLDLAVDNTKFVLGDHCISAKPIDSLLTTNADGSRSVTLTGDTNLVLSDSAGGCATTGSGGDYVYTFTLAQESLVDLQVGPNGTSNYYTQFYVRTVCGDKNTEVFCNYLTTKSATPRSASLKLQPGTYYLWIDAYNTGTPYNGAFSATMTVRDTPTPPAWDTCSAAKAIPFTGVPATETVTLSGEDTSRATDNYGGSCSPSNGPDLVYTFTTTAAKGFTATATPSTNPVNAFRPVIYLRTTCDIAAHSNEWACAAGNTTTPAASIAVNSLPAGTYYLFVDGVRGNTMDAPGKFDLSATLKPVVAGPTNDNCATAQAITLSGGVGTTTTLTGLTTVGAAHDTFLSSNTYLTPDVVFSVTLPAAAVLSATVTPDTGSGYYPAVGIRSVCGGSGAASGQTVAANQLAYTQKSTETAATATTKALLPGTYFIWVTSQTSTSTHWAGGYSLGVALTAPTTAPPANDNCAGVTALTLGTSVTGSTAAANNEYDWGYSNTPGCYPPPTANLGIGPDVVYSYTPATGDPFKFVVTPSGTSWDMVFWVGKDSCGDPRACVGGRNGGTSGAEELTIASPVANATYYLYVEGASATATGSFTVLATTSP